MQLKFCAERVTRVNNEEKILAILVQIQADVSDLNQGQIRLEQRQDKFEQRQDNFEQRQDNFEQRQDRFEQRLEKLEQGQAAIRSDIRKIREDTEITRSAANKLIEWSDRVSEALKVPLYE